MPGDHEESSVAPPPIMLVKSVVELLDRVSAGTVAPSIFSSLSVAKLTAFEELSVFFNLYFLAVMPTVVRSVRVTAAVDALAKIVLSEVVSVARLLQCYFHWRPTAHN